MSQTEPTSSENQVIAQLREELRKEKELRTQAEEELRQSAQLFETVSKATNDAVWDWNLETDELWWSEGLKRIFGYTAEEIEPGTSFWTTQVHPEDRDRVVDSLNNCIKSRGTRWEEEYRFLKSDGSYATILDRGFVIHDKANRPCRMIGAMTDLTDWNAAEQKIQELNIELEGRVKDRTHQLEAANKELESFSYSVSHDLRAPLRAIEGFTRILMEDYVNKLDEEGQRYLKLINGSCHQMAELIEDLLCLSRLGRQVPKIVTVNMNSLVAEVVTELKQVPGWDGEITIGTLPECRGDPSLLRPVWSNLLGNAIKFTSKTSSPRIEVTGRPEGERLVYAVSDNGAGFDMRYANKLFGVFQRLHGRSEFEGHGVGLAIVQRLVHRHGGEVTAEGKIDQGAKFSFSLPKKVFS